MSKKEREIYEFEMDLNNLFICPPMTWFLPKGQVWKRVRILQVWSEITLFGLKSGQDFKNRAALPHQEFAGVPPRGYQLINSGCKKIHVLKNKNRNRSIMTGSWRKIFTPNVFLFHAQTIIEVFEISFQFAGADLGGGCRGCAPPSWSNLRFSNTTGILQKKKKLFDLLVLK